MADATGQEWPNERLKILVPTTIVAGIAMIFLIWRLVYGFNSGRRFLLCDYLLILAQMLNIVCTALMYVVVDNGLGRHFLDPSIGLAKIMRYAYFLWIAQVINIIAVAVLKWSICAYLLVLDFSKVYRAIVWLSILMITVFNFLMPVLTLFGCSPLRSNWDRSTPGKCWAKATLAMSYLQGVSNILTDVVYAVAPVVYLAHVQLSKRTQWGLRAVFLLSIIGTVCSIFKTIELKAITKTTDPTWDGINLSIWSQTELSVGIFIACLPPLRKPFDRLFNKILPSSLKSSHPTPSTPYGYGRSTNNRNDIRLSNFGTSKGTTKNTRPGESVLDRDDESERCILEEDEQKSDTSGGITKTTKVTVVEEREEGGSPSGLYKNQAEWNPKDPHAV